MFAARAIAFSGTAPPPTYSGVSTSNLTSGLSVTVTGTNFVAGATTVKFNGTPGTSVSVSSATSLTVTVPNLSSAQAVTIQVITPGGSASGSGGVFYGVPYYSSISASSGKTGDSITITGGNFTGSGSPTATVGGVSASITNYSGNSTFTVTVPTIATSGAKTVTYTNPGGTMTASNVFTYTPVPTYSSVSPSSAPAGTTITITGTNFVTGNTTVTVGGTSATSVSVSSGTSLTCVVPALGSGGAKNLVITTPGGTATGTNAFTYIYPTVSSVSPPQGKSGATVTVTGTGFVSGATVTIGGTSATSVSVTNDTTLTCVVPTLGSEGTKSIVVTTSGGTGTGTNIFTYYNSYSPASTTYSTAGSGTYTIPAWCNYIDVICMGGGGGGGASSAGSWGGGGSGGSYNTTTVSRAVLGWGTTTLSYTVGSGGTRGGAIGSNQPGTSGGTSSGASISASGGAGGCGACNGAAGSSSGTTTVNGVEYPSAIGGNFGDSSDPNTNPGSGGGGGNSAFGPFDGKNGRAGAVYFRAYQ